MSVPFSGNNLISRMVPLSPAGSDLSLYTVRLHHSYLSRFHVLPFHPMQKMTCMLSDHSGLWKRDLTSVQRTRKKLRSESQIRCFSFLICISLVSEQYCL